jgi:hypothetical protein
MVLVAKGTANSLIELSIAFEFFLPRIDVSKNAYHFRSLASTPQQLSALIVSVDRGADDADIECYLKVVGFKDLISIHG